MYLWKRQATPRWWSDQETRLTAVAGDRLAVIELPNRKCLQIEVACRARNDATQLVREFGGSSRKLRRDWLKQINRAQKTKPLKIGNRLLVVQEARCRVHCPQRKSLNALGTAPKAFANRAHATARLIIPAGAAFGTGEHATTAMSLRMMETLTRKWRPGWAAIDLGTGSGILALAAKRFGAGRVLGIDFDPLAISTAKENARRNGIHSVSFHAQDVRRSKLPSKIDLVAANLFSELLIEILPRLRRSRWLILSGVMRDQEKNLNRALRRNRIDIVKTRRRGKWIAVLGRCSI